MRKKLVAIVLVLGLLLSGCGAKQKLSDLVSQIKDEVSEQKDAWDDAVKGTDSADNTDDESDGGWVSKPWSADDYKWRDDDGYYWRAVDESDWKFYNGEEWLESKEFTSINVVDASQSSLITSDMTPIYIKLTDGNVWVVYCDRYDDLLFMQDGQRNYLFTGGLWIHTRMQDGTFTEAPTLYSESRHEVTFDFGSIAVIMNWHLGKDDLKMRLPITATTLKLELELDENKRLAERPTYSKDGISTMFWDGYTVPFESDKSDSLSLSAYRTNNPYLYATDKDYLLARYVKGSRDELRKAWVSYVTLSSLGDNSDVTWYEDDEITYLNGPRGIFIARQLDTDIWDYRYCTDYYINYAWVGIMEDTLHTKMISAPPYPEERY